MMEPLRTVLTPMARELLRVAHYEYDLYFRGFLHNHLSHGIVSLTAVSASGAAGGVVSDEEIQAHYSEQIPTYEKRRREPVARLLVEKDDDDDDDIYTNNNGIITTENWRECVMLQGGGVKMAGNSGSFLNFFDDEVNKKHNNTIDDDDDDDEDKNNVLSQMLTRYSLDPRVIGRLVGGAVHPLIHLGYACELFAMEPETSKLLLAEALAMQCTTRDQLGTVVAALEPLAVVNEKVQLLTANNGGNRILQVLQEMQQDEALANVPTPENPDKVDYIVSRTDVMSKYYNSFPISESSSGVQLAFEQLYFAALVIVFGSVSNIKEPRLDFFLAHLLTSAVSLRQVLPFLDVKAGAALC